MDSFFPPSPPTGIVTTVMKSLKGQFLVAAPTLTDPNFNRAVVLMLQHDENGALGVIINRTLEVTVRQACEQVLGADFDIDGSLHHGGPCEAVLMVLHSDPFADTDDDPVLPGVFYTTDKDTVEHLLNDPPAEIKFIVGYSGWGAGQLEEELKSGSWIITPATAERIFAPPDRLWVRLITEANLSKWIDPSQIPEDPSVN
jgi:putative transcriptional regulator